MRCMLKTPRGRYGTDYLHGANTGTRARTRRLWGVGRGETLEQRWVAKRWRCKKSNKGILAVINVGRLNEFDGGTDVTVETLRASGMVKHRGRIKVLGEGEIDRALTVHAHRFSNSAIEKIKAAGGFPDA